MKCEQIRDEILDLAVEGSATPSPTVEEHLRNCSECAGKLASLRQTMALLDDWRAPEPSPYFDTRLQARLREVKAEAQGWLAWLRKPAMVLATALLFIVGIALLQSDRSPRTPSATNKPIPTVIQRGTAVGDLETLEDNHDLYANFDVLDDMAPPASTAPTQQTQEQ